MSYIPEYHENYYNVEGTAYNQGKVGIGTFKPIELLHVSGGNMRLDGTGYIDGDLNVSGNLNVYGESTIAYTATVAAEDKNLELNVKTGDIGGATHSGALTNDGGAHGGGLTLKSTDGDHTWTWLDTHESEDVHAWAPNEHIMVTGDNKIFTRDTGLYINSRDDGIINVESDNEIETNSKLLDVNAKTGIILDSVEGIFSIDARDESNVSTASGKLRVEALDDTVEISGKDSVTIDSKVGVVSIDASGDSNLTTESGNIDIHSKTERVNISGVTVFVSGSSEVDLNSVGSGVFISGKTDSKFNTSSGSLSFVAEDNTVIITGASGVTIDSKNSNFSIDASGDSNVNSNSGELSIHGHTGIIGTSDAGPINLSARDASKIKTTASNQPLTLDAEQSVINVNGNFGVRIDSKLGEASIDAKSSSNFTVTGSNQTLTLESLEGGFNISGLSTSTVQSVGGGIDVLGSGNSNLKSSHGNLIIEAGTNYVDISGKAGVELKSKNAINSTAQANSVIKTLGSSLGVSGGLGLLIGSSGGSVEIDGKSASHFKASNGSVSIEAGAASVDISGNTSATLKSNGNVVVESNKIVDIDGTGVSIDANKFDIGAVGTGNITGEELNITGTEVNVNSTNVRITGADGVHLDSTSGIYLEANEDSWFYVTGADLSLSGSNINLHGNVKSNGDVYLGKNLYVSGTGFFEDELYVKSGANFSGDATFLSGAYAKGNFYQHSSRESYLSGKLNVLNSTNLSGVTKIQNQFNVSGATNLSGVTKVEDNLFISGNTNVSGDLNVGGSLFVSGSNTRVDTTTLIIEDKNIELASGAAGLLPRGQLNNAGLTIKSTGLGGVNDDITFEYNNSNTGLVSNVSLIANTGQRVITETVQTINNSGLELYNQSGTGVFVSDSGNVGVKNITPEYALDVSGDINVDASSEYKVGGVSWRQAIWVDAPAAAGSAGVSGTMAYSNDYFYVCVSPNTWKRTALSTF